jgi:4-hydroxy-tetrahydrodipicolinate reductase
MTAIGIYGSNGRMGRAIATIVGDEGGTIAGSLPRSPPARRS